MEPNDLHHLLIAFGLGLLVGLQREWAETPVAGVRTFPLIAVFGALTAMAARDFGGHVLAAGLIAATAMIVLGNVARFKTGETDPGLTTEFAALTMFAVGAILIAGSTAAGIAVGGGVAVLLQWKSSLHRFVRNISEPELRAVTRLVVIGLVILPLLPNRAYGPHAVINPFEIWLMVVLIVGISLGAYLVYHTLGEKAGTILGGLLGGLISSTAMTVSYARRANQQPEMAPTAAVVIMIASTVVFARVLFEIAVVAPGILAVAAPPLLVMGGYMALIAAGMFFFTDLGDRESPDQEPPSNLAAAIVFGLLYAAVLFGVAAAKQHFGNTGLYVVAVLSGMTDMDAITLSSAQMIQSGKIDADIGWRLILVGALSNIVFKAAVVATIGTPRLLGRIAVAFGLSIAGGIALVLFWP